jgi:hypothetical protein
LRRLCLSRQTVGKGFSAQPDACHQQIGEHDDENNDGRNIEYADMHMNFLSVGVTRTRDSISMAPVIWPTSPAAPWRGFQLVFVSPVF